jgi:hypothetical protein
MFLFRVIDGLNRSIYIKRLKTPEPINACNTCSPILDPCAPRQLPDPLIDITRSLCPNSNTDVRIDGHKSSQQRQTVCPRPDHAPISARCHSRQPPSERSRPPLQRAFPSPRWLSAGETGRKLPPEGDTLLRHTTPGLGQLTREADGHHPAVPRAFTLLFKRVSGGMAKRRPGKPAAPSRAVSKPTDLSAHNMWHAKGRP